MPVPRGTYRVVVETNRWRGVYVKRRPLLIVSASQRPPRLMSPYKSVNFESIRITYGGKPSQA